MADICIGDINSIARELDQMCVGDAISIAREVDNIYIGDDNGIAREVYTSFDPYIAKGITFNWTVTVIEIPLAKFTEAFANGCTRIKITANKTSGDGQYINFSLRHPYNTSPTFNFSSNQPSPYYTGAITDVFNMSNYSSTILEQPYWRLYNAPVTYTNCDVFFE